MAASSGLTGLLRAAPEAPGPDCLNMLALKGLKGASGLMFSACTLGVSLMSHLTHHPAQAT